MFDIELYDGKTLWLIPRTYDPSEYEILVRLPERKWRASGNKKGWATPATRLNIEYIYQHYREDVDFTVDKQAKILLTYETLTNKVDAIKSQKRWEYLFNGQDTTFEYPSPLTPFMHQRVTVEAMFGSEYFGLLMDMGTGKSKCFVDEVGIHGIKLHDNEMFRVIIVAPSSLLVNWEREFNKNICDMLDMRIELLNKGDAKSVESVVALMNDPSRIKVLLVSYDSVSTQLLQLKAFHAHMLGCDESHYVKNPATKRWKAIRDLAESCDMRRIMTGTVTCNNILDVWAQFEILRPGALGYQTYQSFKHHYANIVMVASQGGQDFEKIDGFRNVDELKENMARMSFTVKKDRCLDLPQKLFTTVELDMPSDMAFYYNQLLDDFALTLEDDKFSVKAEFILVQLLKLAQVCCGFVVGQEDTGELLIDDETGLEYFDFVRVVKEIPGENVKLRQIVEDSKVAVEEGKLIIWNRFKLAAQKIKIALLAEGITCDVYDSSTSKKSRQRIVDSYNDDDSFKVFIGNPGAGGTGLTLLGTELCPTRNVFYYSNDFSYSKRIQSEDRCHRIGLKNSVSYRDYVYRRSVDEYILSIVKDKRDIADAIKDVASLKEVLLRRV